MEQEHVTVYVGSRTGEQILKVALRANALGHPYFVFNGYLVPSAEVPDDYQKACPQIGFHYLTDLERHKESHLTAP